MLPTLVINKDNFFNKPIFEPFTLGFMDSYIEKTAYLYITYVILELENEK